MDSRDSSNGKTPHRGCPFCGDQICFEYAERDNATAPRKSAETDFVNCVVESLNPRSVYLEQKYLYRKYANDIIHERVVQSICAVPLFPATHTKTVMYDREEINHQFIQNVVKEARSSPIFDTILAFSGWRGLRDIAKQTLNFTVQKLCEEKAIEEEQAKVRLAEARGPKKGPPLGMILHTRVAKLRRLKKK